MPDPFNLKKKTVRMPSSELLRAASDPETFIIETLRDIQEDRNVLVAAQEWNNRMTRTVLSNQNKRLDDGDKLFREVRIIRNIFIYVFVPALVIFLGEYAVHLASK